MPSDIDNRDPRPEVALVDASGTQWRVYEVPYELDRRTGKSLIFDSEVGFRRVRNYPPTWATLSELERCQLLEST